MASAVVESRRSPASLSFCPCRPSRVSRIALTRHSFSAFARTARTICPSPQFRTYDWLVVCILYCLLPLCSSDACPSVYPPPPSAGHTTGPARCLLSRRELYHHACGRRLFRLTWLPPSRPALPCPARLCLFLFCQPVPTMRLFHSAALKHSRSTRSSSDAMCPR